YKSTLNDVFWTKLKDVEMRPTNRVETVLDPQGLQPSRYYRLGTPAEPEPRNKRRYRHPTLGVNAARSLCSKPQSASSGRNMTETNRGSLAYGRNTFVLSPNP